MGCKTNCKTQDIMCAIQRKPCETEILLSSKMKYAQCIDIENTLRAETLKKGMVRPQ